MNHDTSIGEMLDAEDEARIGLLGRPAELQFVRLAAAFNEQKKVLKAVARLTNNDYPDWCNAGGPNECKHGFAEGIGCRLCDCEIVKNYSANDKVSDGGPLTHESKQDANPPFAAPPV